MKKRLAILGGGKSGVGTAILGKQKGYAVFVSDSGKIADENKEILNHHAIDWEENGHSESKITKASLVMKSPGIPDSVPIVKKLVSKGIPVISEIEYASWFTAADIIAITGSNGKTTVTKWIGFILEKAGFDYVMAGNVGNSFAQSVAVENPEHYVLEVSSFQLDGITDFHPHIAVLTNITPDHLDRYDHDFQKYIDAKFRIAKNQTADDYFIYDADDPVIEEQLKHKTIKAKKLPFSFKKTGGMGTETQNNTLTTTVNNNPFIMSTTDLALPGKHNTKNAMAASTVASLIGVRNETIRLGLAKFPGVEHRLERVLKINKVLYINDSKATNINSTLYALECTGAEIIWIAGGVDKGNDYTKLLPLVNEKVKAIICIGKDNSKIINTFGNCVETMVEIDSIAGAVQVAYRLADQGDTVLLSPACSSYDRFKNFEERGRQFKEAVRDL